MAQIFNPNAELVMPTGIPTDEANAEIKIAEMKTDSRNENKKMFKVI